MNAFEYLIGNAIYIGIVCMVGSLIIGLAGGYAGSTLLYFMLIMFIGNILSVLLGAAIGVASKNQMMATSVTVPVMMVLSFLPMLAMFNDTIKKVAKFIYSEQLYMLINSVEDIHIGAESVVILVCNAVLVVAAFVVAYKKVFKRK